MAALYLNFCFRKSKVLIVAKFNAAGDIILLTELIYSNYPYYYTYTDFPIILQIDCVTKVVFFCTRCEHYF